MKDRKKPKGTKARVQAYKKRLTHIGHAIIITILVTIAVSGFFLYSMLYPPSELGSVNPILQFKPENPSLQLKAAIVDHLSLTHPNQTFIETATKTLKQAGYTVDYYSGEKVTVEFYRNLPTHAYRLIILRVHAAGVSAVGPVELSLFTSEPYSQTRYIYEQLRDEVGRVSFSSSSPLYFGISPNFARHCMKGRFANTTIIMMGCDGLKGTQMAKAFIEKGAKVYISWDEDVLSSHTDTATTHLLQYLITEKQTMKQAVDNTMKEVGPDPIDKSLLIYYPLEVGEQTIENITGEN